jgi:hypothetical protein
MAEYGQPAVTVGVPGSEGPLQGSWPKVAGVLLCTMALYGAVVAADLSSQNAYWFVHVGKQSLTAASTSKRIVPSLGWQSPIGYDGQYYYFLALDPRHAKDYMGAKAGYIYSRPLYPALARVASLGSTKRLPDAMLAVNLAAIALGTLALALWLRARRYSPWFALLFSAYPGLIFCVARDLTEPLAFALVAVALLVFDTGRNSRVAMAAVLFALAGLTRETTLLFAAAAALALVLQDRRQSLRSPAAWRRALLFLAGAVIPLFAWRQIIGHYVAGPTQENAGGAHALIPFAGLTSYWPWHGQHLLIVGSVVLPAAVSAVIAALLLRRRVSVVWPLLLLANIVAFVVFLPAPIYVDYGAAGRAAVGVVLAAVYCLPALTGGLNGGGLKDRASKRDVVLLRGATALWSPVWFFWIGLLLGLPILTIAIK